MKKLIYILIFLAFAGIANAQWQSDVRLTNASGSSWLPGTRSSLGSNGNVLHLVWYDDRDGNNEIYYKRSTDGGTTWGADIRLTNTTLNSQQPSLFISGSNILVAYSEGIGETYNIYDIYYKRSTDEGLTWGAGTRLTNDLFESSAPVISVSGSIWHILWYDRRDGNFEIYYKRSTDEGLTWGADTRLTNATGESLAPYISITGSTLHVVWWDFRDGNYEIYYKRSTDEGVTWGADSRLTNNSATSTRSCVSVSASVVHVVWYDDRDLINNPEIYYKRSTDGGTTWGADTRLTNNPAVSVGPDIAVSGSNVNIVWEDYRDGKYEIYYKHSSDGGVTWEADTRLTTANTTNGHKNPQIIISGSALHVVWNDTRDGNREIYYKQNPTGNPTGIQNISTEIPSAFSLSQNYPNPFNPSTYIKFDVSKVSFVSLKVFDALGREVAILVNEQLKPGTYEADWNATNYTSGVYFYKLSTKNYSESRRMVLIK